MGKKKSARKPSNSSARGVGKTLTDEIKQKKQRTLYAKALEKGFENLTAAETRAVQYFELETFARVAESCQKTLVQKMLGSTSRTINDNAERRSFPWPPDREPVNLPYLLSWLWTYFLNHPLPDSSAGKISEEDVLLVGASQDLKDQFLRERIRSTQINNQEKAIKLQTLEESHIPTAQVRTVFGETAAIIAKKREHLERQLDEPAKSLVAQAFEDIADEIETRGSAIDGGSGDEERAA